MRRLDLPPVWGAAAAALVWAWAGTVELLPAPDWMRALGWALVAAAVALAVWAVVTMARRDTPIEPRRTPRALVTDGPFGWARHPIYRGLWMAVAGLALAAGELTALAVAPAYALLLLRRFVEPEEQALEAGFGDAFRAWAARVPRRL